MHMREAGNFRTGDPTFAIVETTRHPFLVIDDRLQVEFANRAFLETFQVTSEETLGRAIFSLGNGQWDIAGLRRLLSDILPKSNSVEGYRVEHDFEAIGRRTMVVNARRLRLNGSGRERILIAIDDITEQQAFQEETTGRAEFAEKLIESLREMVVVLTPDLVVVRTNDAFCDFFRVARRDVDGKPFDELGGGHWNIPELRRMLGEILPNEHAFDDCEVEREFDNIGHRVLLINARQLDHMSLILLTIRDATDERAHAARQTALLGEMQHRVKNIFTGIIALARQSAKFSEDSREFAKAFEARLHALSRTHDLFVDGPNGGADLGDVIRMELTAVGAKEGCRFTLDGPALRLPSDQMHAFAMAIHELGTNAVKYGALKFPHGRIEIRWRQTADEAGANAEFLWRETGVHLPQPAETVTGFGSEVLRRIVPNMLCGRASHDLAADGFRYRLCFSVK